ncbi:aminotransferase class V-fold PLP-dependent enzyme [bacterium]|nr:aminotransferase class V-fold PLP-dependent enzyme [bacterium]
MEKKHYFASDNYSGVDSEILKSLERCNFGHADAYGYDSETEKSEKVFSELFGKKVKPFFVFNGTGSNVVALSSVLNRFESVIASEHAHIHQDECGALELISGCKILILPTKNGKISAQQLDSFNHYRGFEHNVQPKVVSISQSTELGTVYSNSEIKELADKAHSLGMYIHVDGARVSNAVVSQNTTFKEMFSDTGVDILSFGGTKNGLLFGEAVVFLNEELSKNILYVRKQSMQLFSKNRFIASQFNEFITKSIWKKNAENSNRMAQYLKEKLKKFDEIETVYSVDSNAVFAKVEPKLIEYLLEYTHFYIWNESESVVRWMCSFDTTKEDIDNFIFKIEEFYKKL